MPDNPPRDSSASSDDARSKLLISSIQADDPFVVAVKGELVRYQEHLPENARLIVALSGGADSTALLLALGCLSRSLPIAVEAAHINHGIRGQESDEDARFCQDLTEKLGIPFHLRLAAPAGSRSEEHLRTVRYQLLGDIATERAATGIVLGHTLNDQAETMLFRLFRGTSPRGLVGMARLRVAGEQLLLRPLLSLERDLCREFIKRAGIRPREDSSNLDLAYLRNYIRYRVVPSISARLPGFEVAMERLRIVLADEQQFLENLASEALLQVAEPEDNAWALDELLRLHISLQRKLIANTLEKIGVAVSFERVEAIQQLAAGLIRKTGQTAISLNERWDVRLANGRLVWVDKAQSTLPSHPDFEQMVNCPGSTILLRLGKVLKIETESLAELYSFPSSSAMEIIADLSRVEPPLTIRARRPGDFIYPFGMAQAVRLKKYLHTHNPKGSPLRLGQTQLVLADTREVIWVPGVGISEKIRVHDKPTHRLYFVEIAPDKVNIA